MKKDVVKFEDLRVWQKSMDLAMEIYTHFRNCKDFGLKNQIQRAAVSIPSNIAEGFERQHKKEFIQYLYISNGSNAELRTQLIIARRAGIIDKTDGTKLILQTKHISAMLNKLIYYRKSQL